MNESRVPKSRLHQIAQRKLSALGIATALSPDGELLAGEFQPAGAVVNPLSGRALERIRFAAEGHDRVRFLGPPLLVPFPALPFFDVDRSEQLFARIQDALSRRAAAAQAHAARLRTLGLPAELDAERAVVVSQVELAGTGTAIVEGDDRGLRAMRVVPRSGTRPPVSLGEAPIDLAVLDHRVDVELHLSQLAEDALKAPATPAPAAAPASTPGPAAPAATVPAEGLTLGALVAKLGADARVEAGLVISRDLVADGKRVRFAARLEGGKTFRGKVVTTAGTAFDERFDLDRFPGLDLFIAGILGATSVTPGPAARFTPGPAARPGAVPTTPGPAAAPPSFQTAGHILPVAGEIWVMSILVEREDAGEFRYLIADVDGRPVGASRTLPRQEFAATFDGGGKNGWRLLAKVVEVRDGNVSYVQLDPKRRAVGAPRTSGLAGFLANFQPEAAAY